MTTETQTPTNGVTPKVYEVKAQFQAMLAPSSKAVSRKAWGIDVPRAVALALRGVPGNTGKGPEELVA